MNFIDSLVLAYMKMNEQGLQVPSPEFIARNSHINYGGIVNRILARLAAYKKRS